MCQITKGGVRDPGIDLSQPDSIVLCSSQPHTASLSAPDPSETSQGILILAGLLWSYLTRPAPRLQDPRLGPSTYPKGRQTLDGSLAEWSLPTGGSERTGVRSGTVLLIPFPGPRMARPLLYTRCGDRGAGFLSLPRT